MLKIILTVVSIPLFIVHISILYFWIFDWRKLITDLGLFNWVGSIILGVLVYLIYRKFAEADKLAVFNRRLIFISTLTAIILGVFALAIEFATSSMP